MEDDIFVPDPPSTETKYCRKCLQWKPVTDFFLRGGKSRFAKYRASYCKACHTAKFDYEGFCCPHCKNKIVFFGIDAKGEIVKQKSDILDKLRKEAKADVKRTKKSDELKYKIEKDLKDIF